MEVGLYVIELGFAHCSCALDKNMLQSKIPDMLISV